MAGTYISVLGATSSAAQIQCPAGSYCPFGSAAPTADDPGYYSIAGGANQIPCPPGSACLGGILPDMSFVSFTLDPAHPGAVGSIAFDTISVGGFDTVTLEIRIPMTVGAYKVTNIGFSGANAGQFITLGLFIGETLLPGQPADFAIVYAPGANGTATASLTLSIIPQIGADPDFIFALSGVGVIHVAEPGGMALFAGAVLVVVGMGGRQVWRVNNRPQPATLAGSTPHSSSDFQTAVATVS